MKVLLVLAVVVAVAMGEMCKSDKDCTNHGITTCGNGYQVACHMHHCECTSGSTGNTCTAMTDCKCDHGHAHCIDSHCHCTRF